MVIRLAQPLRLVLLRLDNQQAMQFRKRKLVVQQATIKPLQLARPKHLFLQKWLVEMKARGIEGFEQVADLGPAHAGGAIGAQRIELQLKAPHAAQAGRLQVIQADRHQLEKHQHVIRGTAERTPGPQGRAYLCRQGLEPRRQGACRRW